LYAETLKDEKIRVGAGADAWVLQVSSGSFCVFGAVCRGELLFGWERHEADFFGDDDADATPKQPAAQQPTTFKSAAG
jgi:hypothetical protein